MHPSVLGPSVILVHLVPILSHKSLLALAATDKTMSLLLAHYRVPVSVVRQAKNNESIVHSLRPVTLATVTELILNGTPRDHREVFDCPFFTSVKSVTLTTWMTRLEQKHFTLMAQRLNEMRVVGDFGIEGGNDSISHMPPGVFNKLQKLYLEDTAVPDLKTLMFSPRLIPASLSTLSFVVAQTEGVYTACPLSLPYIDRALALLPVLANNNLLPFLREVEIVIPRSVPPDPLRGQRIALLKAIWSSAAMHGGWRLTARRPPGGPIMDVIDPWSCWCCMYHGSIFVTPEEVTLFAQWCEENGRIPRWDDFVKCDVHIEVGAEGDAVENLKNPTSITYDLARSRGLSILPGPRLDLHNALEMVTSSTKCISIVVDSFTGTTYGNRLDPASGCFNGVKLLRLEVEMWAAFPDQPPAFEENICASMVRALVLPQWNNLAALSVPAFALQRFFNEEDPGPSVAPCGRHVSAYSFPWIKECKSLKTFQITSWLFCWQCYEQYEDDYIVDFDMPVWHEMKIGGLSLVAGLAYHIPCSVSAVFITALVEQADLGTMRPLVKGDIYGALAPGVFLVFSAGIVNA